MEQKEWKRPLKIFGWAVIILGIFLYSNHLALYWSDFAFAVGIFLIWFDIHKQRKEPHDERDSTIPYRQAIWKQEDPLLIVLMSGLMILAVTNFPFFLHYFQIRTIIRNVIFLIFGVCLIWLVVLAFRRDFGKASKRTQAERETIRQIHKGAKQKHMERKKKRADRK